MIPIGDERRLPIFPFVVYALIAANVAVWINEINAIDPDRFIYAYAAIPYNITHGIEIGPPTPSPVYLTLFTSMFVHGSWLHIIFNMVFLFAFGPSVEAATGHVRFLALYLICGLAGGLTQTFIGPGSHVPAVGASGAIAGILGAYIVAFPLNRVNTIVPIGCFPLFLQLPAVLVIGIWAASQFINGYGSLSSRLAAEQSGGVAYFAHIGGFVAGVVLIGLFTRRAARGARYR